MLKSQRPRILQSCRLVMAWFGKTFLIRLYIMLLQGALLLILHQISHTLEDRFTKEADMSLEGLFDSVPDEATLVQLFPDGEPDLANVMPIGVEDIRVGSHILVLPGEQVGI